MIARRDSRPTRGDTNQPKRSGDTRTRPERRAPVGNTESDGVHVEQSGIKRQQPRPTKHSNQDGNDSQWRRRTSGYDNTREGGTRWH